MSELQAAIGASFDAYLEYGPRSPQKIYPLHKVIALQVGAILGREKDVYAVKMPSQKQSGEVKVRGSFYEKNIDITVVKGETKKVGESSIKLLSGSEVEFCIGVKFVTSNYKQNINNYFEGMIGETTNIQANNIPYGQLIVLPEKIPYFKKNKEISRWEELTAKDLQKYLKLVEGISGPHKPAFIAIKIVTLNEDGSVTLKDDSALEKLLPGATPILTWDHGLSVVCEKIG